MQALVAFRREMAKRYVFSHGEEVRIQFAHVLMGLGFAGVGVAGALFAGDLHVPSGLWSIMAFGVPGAALVLGAHLWSTWVTGKIEARRLSETEYGRWKRRHQPNAR